MNLLQRFLWIRSPIHSNIFDKITSFFPPQISSEIFPKIFFKIDCIFPQILKRLLWEFFPIFHRRRVQVSSFRIFQKNPPEVTVNRDFPVFFLQNQIEINLRSASNVSSRISQHFFCFSRNFFANIAVDFSFNFSRDASRDSYGNIFNDYFNQDCDTSSTNTLGK